MGVQTPTALLELIGYELELSLISTCIGKCDGLLKKLQNMLMEHLIISF